MKKYIYCAVAVLGLGLFSDQSAEAGGVHWGFGYNNGYYGNHHHHRGNHWQRGGYYGGPVRYYNPYPRSHGHYHYVPSHGHFHYHHHHGGW